MPNDNQRVPAHDGGLVTDVDGQLKIDFAAKPPPGSYSGVEQADTATGGWWRDCCDRAIKHLARLGREFGSAELRDLGVPEPDSANRWGPRFAAARRAGLIRPVSAAPSTVASRRGSLTRRWVGVAGATRPS